LLVNAVAIASAIQLDLLISHVDQFQENCVESRMIGLDNGCARHR
jgi:hypothetical protein